LCATEFRYNVRHPESRINELSREYSDEEGSQQAAGNEPRAIQISPNPPELSLWALSDRFFVPSAEQVDARGRYRRQREYPQPPPPNKSTSKITINRVSIVSPLFGLSISVEEQVVCQNLLFEKGCNFRLLLSSFRETKHERTVAAVESLDQKVEFDFDSRTAVNESV
jgi:hypothetical protein